MLFNIPWENGVHLEEGGKKAQQTLPPTQTNQNPKLDAAVCLVKQRYQGKYWHSWAH